MSPNTNTQPQHTNTHTHAHHISKRLSPELYDNIIRLPILTSNSVLMMIGVLPMHPSPHVSFVRWYVVGGWDLGLGRVAYIVPR